MTRHACPSAAQLQHGIKSPSTLHASLDLIYSLEMRRILIPALQTIMHIPSTPDAKPQYTVSYSVFPSRHMRPTPRILVSSPRHVVIRQVHNEDAHEGPSRLNPVQDAEFAITTPPTRSTTPISDWSSITGAECRSALHESAGTARDRTRR
jgi:hypothetical protein